MRFRDLTESIRPISPELIEWVKEWVASSFKVEQQAANFEPLRDEASRMLNVAYPAIYRGLSITEEQAEQLGAGETITIPAYRLQSWTKSRAIANDFALPGHGGDVGLLIKKSDRQVSVVLDVENVVRRIGRRGLEKILGSRDKATDAGREREVVVETNGSLAISPRDVLKMT